MKFPHTAQNSLASRSRKSASPCFATVRTVLLVSISLVVPAAPAATIPIRFIATNLVDTAPGQDLWQYQYSVSNLLPNSGQGFSIFFDRGLYRDLKSPPAATNEGWDLLSIQPDPVMEFNGFFDTLALLTGASLVPLGDTLDGVMLASDLTLPRFARLDVKNGLTLSNNAKITLLGGQS